MQIVSLVLAVGRLGDSVLLATSPSGDDFSFRTEHEHNSLPLCPPYLDLRLFCLEDDANRSVRFLKLLDREPFCFVLLLVDRCMYRLSFREFTRLILGRF